MQTPARKKVYNLKQRGNPADGNGWWGGAKTLRGGGAFVFGIVAPASPRLRTRSNRARMSYPFSHFRWYVASATVVVPSQVAHSFLRKNWEPLSSGAAGVPKGRWMAREDPLGPWLSCALKPKHVCRSTLINAPVLFTWYILYRYLSPLQLHPHIAQTLDARVRASSGV